MVLDDNTCVINSKTKQLAMLNVYKPIKIVYEGDVKLESDGNGEMDKYQTYGVKLYIPLEDLNKYISEHIDESYKDFTFVPSKVEVNEMDFGIEINLLSINPHRI